MPEICRFYGIIIKMYYSDHNPPHFHVEYQNYEAIIEIDNGVIIGQMPRRQLNLIYEWLDINKQELVENWELATGREPLNKIDPLKK